MFVIRYDYKIEHGANTKAKPIRTVSKSIPIRVCVLCLAYGSLVLWLLFVVVTRIAHGEGNTIGDALASSWIPSKCS